MRSWSERQTHSDRPVENETHDTLRPQNPAEGAINSSRQTSAQRDEAISPNSPNRCPAGEGPTSNFNRRTEPRTKDQCQLRPFGPRCLRRTNVKLRSGSIPSWATLRSTRATGITHPGFYGRKPWRKPNSAIIITAPETRCEYFWRPTAQIVHFSYRKLQQKFTEVQAPTAVPRISAGQ